jgi:hypothetical protein
MLSLENLRKQAKLFLRWHRMGYYPVAAQIRTVLPRYQHLSDAQVLAHSFKLSDAQELVARRLGFENWQALKAGIKTMTERDIESAAKAVLIGAAPQLFVADLQASCDFFTRKLGFVTDFIYGNPPFYGQVLRDGAQLALRRVDWPVLDGIASARHRHAGGQHHGRRRQGALSGIQGGRRAVLPAIAIGAMGRTNL